MSAFRTTRAVVCPPSTKRHLSPARQTLLGLMQRINFGQIIELVVRDREPVLDPPPEVEYEFKFPGDNGPRLECDIEDFAIKDEIKGLFALFDRLQNVRFRVLRIRNGLPFLATARRCLPESGVGSQK